MTGMHPLERAVIDAIDTDGLLAFHHRQCPHETETFVSKDSCLTEY